MSDYKFIHRDQFHVDDEGCVSLTFPNQDSLWHYGVTNVSAYEVARGDNLIAEYEGNEWFEWEAVNGCNLLYFHAERSEEAQDAVEYLDRWYEELNYDGAEELVIEMYSDEFTILNPIDDDERELLQRWFVSLMFAYYGEVWYDPEELQIRWEEDGTNEYDLEFLDSGILIHGKWAAPPNQDPLFDGSFRVYDRRDVSEWEEECYC